MPNTGPYDVAGERERGRRAVRQIGPGILVTHSQSGTLGWRTAINSRNVRAIVSFEPGGDFLFPEGEAPSVPFGARTFTPPTIPMSDFMQLTKVPIIIYYGDNIPEQPSYEPGAGAVARLPFRGAAMARRREPARRRCDARRAAVDRHPREYALPDVGPEQRRDREPPRRLARAEEARSMTARRKNEPNPTDTDTLTPTP